MRSIALSVLLLLLPAVAAAQTYRFEAEDGNPIGTYISSTANGYSGTGYVTGFDSDSGPDRVELQANIPAGLYEMWVGYRSIYGEKGYTYRVNGETGNGMFDQSLTFSADRAGLFSIPAGTSSLAIEKYWGYYDIDYWEFRPFTPPTVQPIAATLSDANADGQIQLLMRYLASQYGQKTLSGQQHEVSSNLAFPGQSYLDKSGGVVPAIRGSDFIDYSPSRTQHGANPRNETEQSIQWAEQTGGIVTMMWHWNAPTDLIDQPGNEWWRGFYSYATTFDLPGALANPSGEDYQLILRDIDAIAVELQKFEDAGVPVIWRPLHEAQGAWFWWGDHGPEAFKELWHLMYDRLTNVHGLHNLIWEYTSVGMSDDFFDWYPGDDVVDMIGADVYTDPTSSMSGEWYDLLDQFNGRKMIALSETGTLPDPEVMDQWGIEWSYFSPWNGTFVDAFSAADLQATLGHEDIITLEELPALPWKENTVFQGADFDFDGDVDGDDLVRWQSALGMGNLADADLDSDSDGADFLIWQRTMTQAAELSSFRMLPEPMSIAAALIAFGATPFIRPLSRKQKREEHEHETSPS